MSQDQVTSSHRRALLLQSASSHQALDSLYLDARRRNPRLSMGVLCRMAGIPSTGNLSDVLKGRRVLASKYATSLATALGLDTDEATYFQALVDRDRAAPDAVKVRGEIGARLTRAGKRLAVAMVPASQGAPELLLAIEVFAAFGLFGNKACLADLVGCFGRSRSFEVQNALRWLLERGLIGRAERKDVFEVKVAQFTIRPDHATSATRSSPQPSLGDLVAESLRQGANACQQWFSVGSKSHFETAVLSVRASTLGAKLAEFKKEFLDLLGRLEDSPADDLMRVVIAIHPFLSSQPKSKRNGAGTAN